MKTPHKKQPVFRRRRRRGIAILVVLGLLAITLALSYSMTRSEATVAQVQQNYDRKGDAKHAAMTGINVALREMQEPGWHGVGVPLEGTLGEGVRYEVTFETGDSELKKSDPLYYEYPYRVTVTSTGHVADPEQADVESTHQIQVVTQLIRRQLSSPPQLWNDASKYSLYQWGSGAHAEFGMPFQIDGPVRLQDSMELTTDGIGDGDDKPFHGEIDQVVLLKKALSADEVETLGRDKSKLTDIVRRNATSTVSWWDMASASGNIVKDRMGRHHGLYDGPTKEPTTDVRGARFDGYNDAVHVGAVDVAGDEMTILAWFKVDSFRHDDARIISKATGTNENDHYWMLSTIKKSGKLRLRFRLKTDHKSYDDSDKNKGRSDKSLTYSLDSFGSAYGYNLLNYGYEFNGYHYYDYYGDDDHKSYGYSKSKTTQLIASKSDVRAGQWVFAAAVYDGKHMRLYQDGELVGNNGAKGRIVTNPYVLTSIGNNPPGSPRARLLRDLARIKERGVDLRPFTNSITLPTEASDELRNLLEEDLGVEVLTANPSTREGLPFPAKVGTYQLYPGGKVYQAVNVGSRVTNNLRPDAVTNPLGMFYSHDRVKFEDSIQLYGTLLVPGTGSRGDVELRGSYMKLQSVSLPPLYGDSREYHLPVVAARNEIRVYDQTKSRVSGAVIAGDEFRFNGNSRDTYLGVQGRLLARGVRIEPGERWKESKSWWHSRHRAFMRQLGRSGQQTEYLPHWLLEYHDLDPTPRFSLKPPAEDVVYHWPDWERPVFVPHPDDGGLRWEVVDWRDLTSEPKPKEDQSGYSYDGYDSYSYDDYDSYYGSSSYEQPIDYYGAEKDREDYWGTSDYSRYEWDYTKYYGSIRDAD